jgi:hypothetical protein
MHEKKMSSSSHNDADLDKDLPPMHSVEHMDKEKLSFFSTIGGLLYCPKLYATLLMLMSRAQRSEPSEQSEEAIEFVSALYNQCTLSIMDKGLYDCFKKSYPKESFDNVYYNYLVESLQGEAQNHEKEIDKERESFIHCMEQNQRAYKYFIESMPKNDADVANIYSKYRKNMSTTITHWSNNDSTSTKRSKILAALNACSISEKRIPQALRLTDKSFDQEKDPSRLNRIYEMVLITRCLSSQLCSKDIASCIQKNGENAIGHCIDDIDSSPCQQQIFEFLKKW